MLHSSDHSISNRGTSEKISAVLAKMMIKRNSEENKVIKTVIYLEKATLICSGIKTKISSLAWANLDEPFGHIWMSKGMNRATSIAKLTRCHRWRLSSTILKVAQNRRRSMQPKTRCTIHDNSFPGYGWLLPGWLAEERQTKSGRVYI